MFIILILVTFIFYLVVSVIRLNEIKLYDSYFSKIADNTVVYYQLINDFFSKYPKLQNNDYTWPLEMNDQYISNNSFIKEVVSYNISNNSLINLLGNVLKTSPFKVNLNSFISENDQIEVVNSGLTSFRIIRPLIIFNIVTCSFVRYNKICNL